MSFGDLQCGTDRQLEEHCRHEIALRHGQTLEPIRVADATSPPDNGTRQVQNRRFPGPHVLRVGLSFDSTVAMIQAKYLGI